MTGWSDGVRVLGPVVRLFCLSCSVVLRIRTSGGATTARIKFGRQRPEYGLESGQDPFGVLYAGRRGFRQTERVGRHKRFYSVPPLNGQLAQGQIFLDQLGQDDVTLVEAHGEFVLAVPHHQLPGMVG
jgi:hypothetical protein